MKVSIVPPSATRRCYRLRYRDADKVQHWRSCKTTSYESAVKQQDRWEREIEAGEDSPSKSLGWKAFKARYEAEALPGFADTTRDMYSTTLRLFEATMSPSRIVDVDTGMLTTFAARIRKGRSETTVETYLSHMSAALRWAKRMKIIPRMPEIPKIQRAKGSRTFAKGRPLTEVEYQAMLAAVPLVTGPKAAPSWLRWVEGLWWSGLRLEESLDLSWDSGGFRVDFSGSLPMFRIDHGWQKSNEAQLLAMAPEFYAFLCLTPEKQRTGPVFPLAPRYTSTHMTPKYIGHILALIGKKANIAVGVTGRGKVKYASAHDLRRSFGSRWAVRVLPIVLKELMRHADIETTLRYYVGMDAQRTAQAAWDAIRPKSGP